MYPRVKGYWMNYWKREWLEFDIIEKMFFLMFNFVIWFLTPVFYCIGKVVIKIFGEFDVWETIK